MKELRVPYAASVLDRSSELRLDKQGLAESWKSAKIIHLARQRFLTDNSKLTFLSADQIATLDKKFSEGLKIFLGIANGVHYFAYCTDVSQVELTSFDEGGDSNYLTLREVDGIFSEFEIAICMHAQSLSNWHHAHPKCAKCGKDTNPEKGGSIRICESCGAEHFPRVDPAIIVLLRDRQDRIILGRQKIWPAKRFSCFAGFVEPGESFEQTVEREVLEEAGVAVSEIKYLTSQPWPFPASLMISFEAVTDTPDLVKPDGEEIEAIKVLSREQFEAELASEELLLPPKVSVARKMIEAWRRA